MSDGTTPSTLTGPTRAPTSTHRAVLNTIRGSAGNLVEWYDVYVYTVFASYFEAQFFDKNDTNSTLYIYAIFAVTFVMRPVGSWFFGRYADRRGRKASLVLSIAIMSTCSFVVAVMPTREIIGWWAAVILFLARLVQGFATGGEYGTSATYMSEAATANRRGFLSSFQYVTLVGGHVLAQFTLLIALHFLDADELQAWGWRIGFFIGGIAALVVLWIRRSMDESLSESHLEAIREGEDRDAGSLKTLFTTHWRPLLLVFLITAGGTVAFYTYSVNAPAIVKSTFGSDRALTATWVNLLGLIFLMLLQPVGGIISDRVGRKPLLIFFGVGGVIYTYVLLTFLPKTTSAVMAFVILAVGYVIITGYTSVNAIVKAELFPAEIRALGVGLGYALANSVFGGTAPMLYQAAKSADHVGRVHRLCHGGDRREPVGLHLRSEEQGEHGARPRAGKRLGCACFGRSVTRPNCYREPQADDDADALGRSGTMRTGVLVCATTAAATLPCRCPSSPLRRCGSEHDQARVVFVGGRDDALPGRRRFNGLAARQESGLVGQRCAVGGGPLGGVSDLGGPVGVEVLPSVGVNPTSTGCQTHTTSASRRGGSWVAACAIANAARSDPS